MNPVVTTIELIEEDISNSSLALKGNSINNEWEITAWGFWYYKKVDGIETKIYVASSTTPLAEGNFLKSVVGLLPYTAYVFQARAYYRIWNDELEDWDYTELFGEWMEATTHAYLTTLQVFACNILKSIGTVTFHGTVDDTDGDNCIERGFEYGLTKTPKWKVSEEGNFATGIFSLGATELPSNTDFYVRTYLKSSSGHYAYTGGGEDVGWQKFTTKTLTNDLAVLSNAGFFTINEDYLRIFNNSGQENNAFKLPSGEAVSEATVDEDGNVYYGYSYLGSYYIGKRLLSNGSLVASYPIDGYPRGVCLGNSEELFTLETDTQAKNAILNKRDISDLSVISHIDLVTTSAYFCGIIADTENHVFVGRTTDPDRIEKYALYDTYEILDILNAGVEGEGVFV